MSVLVEFAMFPTDKGDSVSQYVSKIIDQLRNSQYTYQLTSMGTIFETNTMKEALDVIQSAYEVLEPHSNRIYSSIKFDVQKGKTNRIQSKVNSIEQKIGEVTKSC